MDEVLGTHTSSRATAGSTGAPGLRPAPGPVTPSASTPHAPGIAAISSATRLVIVSMWAVRASIWSTLAVHHLP
ncbi:MAG: hypothetical protein ABSB01_23875 [Streptosporangiaceae bacterium]